MRTLLLRLLNAAVFVLFGLVILVFALMAAGVVADKPGLIIELTATIVAYCLMFVFHLVDGLSEDWPT